MRRLLHQSRSGRQLRSGSAAVEFALATSFIFLPILAGLATVGNSMVVAMKVANLNATAGQMFAAGTDFSANSPNNAAILNTVGGSSLGLAAGNSIVILSEMSGTGAGAVCTRQQIVGGNPGLRASSYANPSSSILDPSGSGAVTNLNDPSAQASAGFNSLMPLAQGQTAYLAETYFDTSSSQKYTWAFAPGGTGTGIYVKAVF